MRRRVASDKPSEAENGKVRHTNHKNDHSQAHMRSNKRPPTGHKSSISWQVVALLVSGTYLALLAQTIHRTRAVDPRSQTLAWTKYVFAFALPGVRRVFKREAADKKLSVRGKRFMLVLGVLDTAAYSLSSLGIAYAGPAWSTVLFSSMNPTCTAFLSRFVLRKRLNTMKICAVVLVVSGVILSSVSRLNQTNGGFHLKSNQILGVVSILASAVLYSINAILYERLVAGEEDPPTHSEAVRRVTFIGVIATTAFQLLYTVPNMQYLVMEPLERSNTKASTVILLHALFGVLFYLHMQIQSRVMQRHGALVMGVVNAVKGSMVTATSALFFCTADSPGECCTVWTGLGALIVTSGGTLWSLAGKGRSKKT